MAEPGSYKAGENVVRWATAITPLLTPPPRRMRLSEREREREGVKLELAEINISEEMKCTGQELFNAFTRKDMIQIFTNCDAKMTEQAIESGSFELLGGNITGKFIEVSLRNGILSSL